MKWSLNNQKNRICSRIIANIASEIYRDSKNRFGNKFARSSNTLFFSSSFKGSIQKSKVSKSLKNNTHMPQLSLFRKVTWKIWRKDCRSTWKTSKYWCHSLISPSKDAQPLQSSITMKIQTKFKPVFPTTTSFHSTEERSYLSPYPKWSN